MRPNFPSSDVLLHAHFVPCLVFIANLWKRVEKLVRSICALIILWKCIHYLEAEDGLPLKYLPYAPIFCSVVIAYMIIKLDILFQKNYIAKNKGSYKINVLKWKLFNCDCVGSRPWNTVHLVLLKSQFLNQIIVLTYFCYCH